MLEPASRLERACRSARLHPDPQGAPISLGRMALLDSTFTLPLTLRQQSFDLQLVVDDADYSVGLLANLSRQPRQTPSLPIDPFAIREIFGLGSLTLVEIADLVRMGRVEVEEVIFRRDSPFKRKKRQTPKDLMDLLCSSSWTV